MGQGVGRDIESVFDEALRRASSLERAAFLDAACAGDPAMRTRIDALLRAHDSAESFLEDPVNAVVTDWPARPVEKPSVEPGDAGPGSRIGSYKLLQQIGEGGFGSVYMADQEQPVRRRVALKILKLGMDTRRVIARFEAERQALAMMDHANIAKVLDAGATETGRPYFVMELVKGEPITDFADKATLPIRDRLNLFVQVCQAVQHAHTKGIIHRDLKPSNVLVSTQDGKPFAKVIDFGIAKATESRLTDKTLFTEHKALIGTPEYMSPEQAEGSLDIDTRTDVYSLGVLLYELLTGSTPFASTTLRSAPYGEIQRIIREVEPPRPSTRLSESAKTALSVAAFRRIEPKKLGLLLRGDMDWIVMRALEKERARRYETAAALALDIKRHLDGEPVVAAPPSAGYRLRKFARRHRGAMIAGAFVTATLLLGIAGTTTGMVLSMREKNQKEIALQAEALQRSIAERNEQAAVESARRAADEAARADRAATRAARKAEVADSTIQFLRDALAPADRTQQQGNPDVTVREVMDQVSASLLRGPAAYEPEVEAAVRDVVGTTYRALGRYDEAEPHLRRAVELQDAVEGEGHTHGAQARSNLALVLNDLGKFDESETLMRRSLATEIANYGEGSAEVAESQQNLAAILSSQGQKEEAERLTRGALEIRRRLTPGDIEVATSMNQLGVLLGERGQLAEAEDLCRGALEIVTRHLGPEHPKVSITLSNLGSILQDRAKFDEAVAVLVRAAEMRRRLFGADHIEVVPVLNNLATAQSAAGDLAGAIANQKEALAILRRVRGQYHAGLAVILNNLALMQQNAGDLGAAEASLRESADIVRRTQGPDHRDYGAVLFNLARLIENRGDGPRALALMEESLSISRAQLPAGHPRLINILGRAAILRAGAGDTAGAETLLGEVVELSRTLPEDTPDRHNSLLSVVTARLLMGQIDAAEPLAREVMLLRDMAYPDGHPLVWRKHSTRSLYGGILVDKAGRLLDQAKELPPGSAESADLVSGAVRALEQAEGFVVPAYEASRNDPLLPGVKPGSAPDRRREMLEVVVRMHDLHERARPGEGHAEKAASRRREMESMR